MEAQSRLIDCANWSSGAISPLRDEHLPSHMAVGTDPLIRKLIERSPWRNVLSSVAHAGIVNVTASHASIARGRRAFQFD